MKIAVYPGSFDPITNGHLDILNRACALFDKVIVLVATNPNKSSNFSTEERVEMIKESTKGNKKVEVTSDSGLTVEFAKKRKATHLIRGLRAVSDFEYEFQLASANEFIDPKIDTVFLMARGDKTFISSSSIITMAKQGIDVSKLVPSSVLKRLK
ncbi:MAG: pantetheine-phosphate adenylyltransferase [Bacilli bacterium]|nr:pantetheine-phosphate adenylyltransferase [Bacilli bacterium]